MNSLIKYLAFIFLLNNLFFGILKLNQLAEDTFFLILGFSLLITIYSIKILKTFTLINICNTSHEIYLPKKS